MKNASELVGAQYLVPLGVPPTQVHFIHNIIWNKGRYPKPIPISGFSDIHFSRSLQIEFGVKKILDSGKLAK